MGGAPAHLRAPRRSQALELVDLGEVAHLDVGGAHHAPVPRQALEVPLTLHSPVVLTHGLVVLDSYPPTQGQALNVLAHEHDFPPLRPGGHFAALPDLDTRRLRSLGVGVLLGVLPLLPALERQLLLDAPVGVLLE